jgi:hypothetical protein
MDSISTSIPKDGASLVDLTVQCHCRLTSFGLSVPTSSLPFKSAICHCNGCRRSTGQLFATWAVIPTPHPPDGVLNGGNLTRYDSSETCKRWFCRRCGASVINVDHGDPAAPEWEVATGVLSFDDSSLHGKLQRVQLWVDDVDGDGGAVGWINRGKLAGMDRHGRGRESEMVDDETIQKMTGRKGRLETQSSPECNASVDCSLHAHCHCGNVEFSISRPADDSDNHDSDSNKRETAKFQATLDTCNSCRRVSGFETTSWATVPKTILVSVDRLRGWGNVVATHGSRMGHYKTSTDVTRYFCGTCGATVFYHKEDGQGTVDIAVGILDPGKHGERQARVEDWLAWEKYPKCLVYQEDAVDRPFVGDLLEGMRLAEEVDRD